MSDSNIDKLHVKQIYNIRFTLADFYLLDKGL